MDRLFDAFRYFLFPFIISALLTPLAIKIGLATGAYAVENKRTVHEGKIVRIGGIAIFVAFCLSMAIFVIPDRTFNAIVIGGAIVFLGGLIDDLMDLKPLYKLLFEIAGALVVIVFGNVRLDIINLPFISLNLSPISFAISLLWIVGVTNAINLIDGLDGLSSGTSIIVLCVIGLIANFMNKTDVSIMAILLVGSIAGFLPYNFNPASLFVGDCGALYMGYMIACYALLGFKSSMVITLVFPLIILFVPLADTSLAIIRRKLKGQKISEADRSHLHHILMYKVGLSHRNTVLLLYFVTFMFGCCAILTYFNQLAGMIMLVILGLIAWIFIELTGMINPSFHPLIGLCRRLTGYPKKSDDAFFEANKKHHID